MAPRSRRHDAVSADRPGSPEAGLELVREEGTQRSPAEGVTHAELEALAGLGAGGRWHVGGHVVTLSNLEKVLFPGSGHTKRDLVRYYSTIAPVMLPYLRERPLNVDRWPDGVGGKTHFWQKQIPSHAPEWVARWDYPEACRCRMRASSSGGLPPSACIWRSATSPSSTAGSRGAPPAAPR